MAKGKKNALMVSDTEKILEFLEGKSESIVNLIEQNKADEYMLIYKSLTHSDIITSGKRTGTQGLDKYYLCYLTTEELEKINEVSHDDNDDVESAKQSNITLPHEFFKMFNIQLRVIGEDGKKHAVRHNLNDYAKVYLVNDTMKYFNENYTNKVFEKLNKNVQESFLSNQDLNLANEEYTPIELSTAAHGVGLQENVEFHKLRHFMFRNDFLMFLIRTNQNNEKEIYILLEKNPKFFTLVNETNEQWQKYLEKQNQIAKSIATTERFANDINKEKTRVQQNKWRNMLAQEIMNYTNVDNEVFCPFTLVEANYYELGTLFRASHIKAFRDSDSKEAYDINNGLLLLASADALFDKYLISVDENKKLIFSFFLKDNYKLISKLLLNQPIFDMILNDQRMEYMKEHRKKFFENEEKRKTEENYDVNDIYFQESVNEDSEIYNVEQED